MGVASPRETFMMGGASSPAAHPDQTRRRVGFSRRIATGFLKGFRLLPHQGNYPTGALIGIQF